MKAFWRSGGKTGIEKSGSTSTAQTTLKKRGWRLKELQTGLLAKETEMNSIGVR